MKRGYIFIELFGPVLVIEENALIVMMFRDDVIKHFLSLTIGEALFDNKKGKGNHPPCQKSNQYIIYERKTNWYYKVNHYFRLSKTLRIAAVANSGVTLI